MNATPTHITLVGCGNMGKALLQGWLKSGTPAEYLVIEPSGLPELFRHERAIAHVTNPDERVKKSAAVVLAVKPQVMNDACAGVRPFITTKTLILSIAAGRSIERFEKIFGSNQPIVRSMPNLPASVGKGMTVAVANKNVSPAQKQLADTLLKGSGLVEWTTDENIINAVTAVSGSGPAYVFYLMEVLTEAGKKSGLSDALAKKLARQTVIGGAALAAASPDTDAAMLRKNVTSAGGTTEAALKILMNGEMQKLFSEAVEAAKKRGAELSS